MNIIDILLASLKFSVIIPLYIMCALPVMQYRKVKNKILLPVVSIALLVLSSICGVLKVYFNLKNVVVLIPLIVLSMIAYFASFNINKLKMWYIFISVTAIISFSSLASYTIEAVIKENGYSSDIQTYGLLVQWIMIAVSLIAYVAALPKTKWLIKGRLLNSVWKFVWIVPALIIATNVIMIPFNYSNAGSARFTEIYATIITVLILLYVLFQIMLYIIAKMITDKVTAEKKSQLLSIQATQYENLKKYIENTSRLRHDFLHMARTASQLAKNNDNETLIKLLDDYGVSTISSHTQKIFCEHTALNAVVCYYYDEARKHSIECEWKVAIPNNISVSDIELCSIVGNLLDNAIHGCMTVEKSIRRIVFNADIEKNDDIYIVATNNFDGIVKKENNKYATTKEKGNGIGLESIRTTVEKHNGYVNFYNDQQYFYTDIMMKQNIN